MRSDPDRTSAVAMNAEDLAHPGLGHRVTRCGSAQHNEAVLRRTIGRSFVAQIVGDPDEEPAMDRDDAFSAALAHDANSSEPDVNVGQAQRADLAGAETAEQHRQHNRSVPIRQHVGEELVHIVGIEGLGQPLRLAHQPATRAGPP